MTALLIIGLSALGLLVTLGVIVYENRKKPVTKLTPAEEAMYEIDREAIVQGVGRLDHTPGQPPLQILTAGKGWETL